MKLLVFGATGETGREIVKQSLKLGHFVTVLVRDLQKMDIRHDNLEVIKGDARDLSSFETVLAGKDAVLSCIGTRECRGPFQFTSLYSDTMKNMILAMKRNDVKRIVAVTSWCTQPGPNNPWFIEWFLKPFIIGAVLRDMAIMEEMLAKTDEDMINYTIVRPPRLLSVEGNENYKVQEGQCNTNTSQQIPRADVAQFMLKTLETSDYDRKAVAIASYV